MEAGQSHGPVTPPGSAGGRCKRGFVSALALSGSLALLADAAHMLTDAGGLALALIAIRFAERPATPQDDFRITHATIQIEDQNLREAAGELKL